MVPQLGSAAIPSVGFFRMAARGRIDSRQFCATRQSRRCSRPKLGQKDPALALGGFRVRGHHATDATENSFALTHWSGFDADQLPYSMGSLQFGYPPW